MRPRKITLLPLIAATYFIVAGGPYGLEEIVGGAGYGGALAILLLTPFLWALPTTLMVGELASALPCEGGYYVWVTRALGRFWGFQEAWLSLAGSLFDMAIYPTLFVSYLGRFAPSVTSNGKGLAIGVALIAVCTLWNLAGAKTVGLSSTVLGILLLSPFAVLTGYAFLHRASAAAASPQSFDLLGGILVAMWNFMGWDNASTVAGEVERPQRTYPRAMAGAVALVTLTYILPVGAAGLAGVSLGLWTTGGWVDVARALFHGQGAGDLLAAAITLGGMIGAVGTFNTLTMCYSRIPMVMAQDGFLPKVFARTTRTGAPWVSALVCAVAWAAFLGLSFVKLIVLDVLLTGLSILLEFAALVALRIREPELPRPYRVPGGIAVAAGLGVFPCILLALTVIRNSAERIGPFSGLELGLVIVAAGVVAYFLGDRWFQK